MTTVSDQEWAGLVATWGKVADLGGEQWIRRLVIRQNRVLRLTIAAEVMVTVVMLGATAWIVSRNPTRALIGWAVAAVIHTIVIWAFTTWNRRGIWRPMGESTRAYLALARERAIRERVAAWFVIGMVTVEGALLAAWYGFEVVDRPLLSWAAPLSVMGLAMVWGVWRQQWARRRLERLRELERELTVNGS